MLHLKEDAAELADPVRLARLIKQYSQFIAFPIKLWAPSKEAKSVVDAEATAKKQAEADAKAKEADAASAGAGAVEPVTKTEYEDVWAWRVENDNKPIWTRSPKEVSDPDYAEFFKATFGEFLDPLAHVHFNVEGTIEFSALLYVPGMAPFEQQQWNAKSRSIKLYVRRVFISDEFDESLMPRWLSFVKGVVDSSDLPLNVSREILQESRVVRVIRKQLVRRSVEMMEDLAKKEGGEDYITFWEAFGQNVKIGAIEDQEMRPRLAKLLRFRSSKVEGLVSFDDYVARMKEGQKGVYYMAADSVGVAAASPFVEKLTAEGYEVLYLTEAIDEAVATNLAKVRECFFCFFLCVWGGGSVFFLCVVCVGRPSLLHKLTPHPTPPKTNTQKNKNKTKNQNSLATTSSSTCPRRAWSSAAPTRRATPSGSRRPRRRSRTPWRSSRRPWASASKR